MAAVSKKSATKKKSSATKKKPSAVKTRKPTPAARTKAGGGNEQQWPSGRKPTHYTPEWKEYFRDLIQKKRKEILHELGYLEESSLKTTTDTYSGDSSTYSFHMADQGTDAQEREKSFMFASRDGKLLRLLDQALERIDLGTYGICQATDEPIEFKRLEAIPHAKYSIAAKKKIEESKNSAE